MGLRGVGLAVVLVHGAAHAGDVTEGRETKGEELEKPLEIKEGSRVCPTEETTGSPGVVKRIPVIPNKAIRTIRNHY